MRSYYHGNKQTLAKIFFQGNIFFGWRSHRVADTVAAIHATMQKMSAEPEPEQGAVADAQAPAEELDDQTITRELV